MKRTNEHLIDFHETCKSVSFWPAVKNFPFIFLKRAIASAVYISIYIIDQARGQDGWMLAELSFCVFMDRDEVEVYEDTKREQGQYPAILTELAWSIKDLLNFRLDFGEMLLWEQNGQSWAGSSTPSCLLR